MKFLPAVALFLVVSPALAEDPPCPPPYAVCLKPEDKKKVVDAVKELQDVKGSPAEVTVQDPVVVVGDWDGRVYVNGGDKKPLRMKLKIGQTIDRDMAVKMPVQVSYRTKPPDPMFRLRVRAQVGLLVPELIRSFKNQNLQPFWDAGLGWDFFHIGVLNLSAYTGIRSAGGGPGVDLTKNFGVYAGYSLVYDGLHSSVLSGLYLSFN